MSRRTAAVFELAHDEKIFGCGESFTRLDKRGQKVNAWTRDAMGVENEFMYKPIPFFLSSRGIYAQALDSSARGFPMLRALFFEYPEDPTSWTIDDEYMFGSSLLVAPLLESGEGRRVYLPPGEWIDYQTGKTYAGERWHRITTGQIPVVLLVKDHTVIPHVRVAQSTADIDWKNVELRVFSTDDAAVSGLFALPDGGARPLNLTATAGAYALQADPLRGQVKWHVTRFPSQ